eukprot:CAMPEP_0179047378 /NCGR_PEP_ID=MMETSP0796-20121207/19167_1 /TAXON_ID=73915 /ORGANISM="Pyrodinium bahamense, Strain pbaha01" /LENGTH=93 /DNA_ID=CAMNT_0020743823 /DNA_START=71 /DNA_END=348 /DNA_ORIENTATION=+
MIAAPARPGFWGARRTTICPPRPAQGTPPWRGPTASVGSPVARVSARPTPGAHSAAQQARARRALVQGHEGGGRGTGETRTTRAALPGAPTDL